METQPIKENKSSKLDNLLKIVIIIAIVIITFFIARFLSISPMCEKTEFEACFDQCIESVSGKKECTIMCGRQFSN